MDANERFEVGASIGRDELGEVRKAKDRETGEPVALKIFEPWVCALDEGLAAYERQLEGLQGLALVRTPPIIGWHLGGEQSWLATGWVEGSTLASLLAADDALDAERALEIACGLLLALDELHKGDAVHGGLTPRKILFAGNPSAATLVLSDPSQCLLYGVSDPIRTSRAEPDRFLGLPQYFSPEQAQGKLATPASDLYVAALVLYEMLVGKPPFESSAKHTTLRRQIYERPLPVRLARPGLAVHESLDEMLLSVLSKEPEKRFASASEFRDALLSIRASADGNAERAARPLDGAAATLSAAGASVASEAAPEDAPEDGAATGESKTASDPDPAEVSAEVSAGDAGDAGDAASASAAETAEAQEEKGAREEKDAQEERSSRRRKGKRGRRKKNTSRGEPVAAVAALAGDSEKAGSTSAGQSADKASTATGADPAKGAKAATPDPETDSDAASKEKAAGASASSDRAAGADGEAQGDEHASWFSIGDDAEKFKEHQTQRIILEQRLEDSRTQRRSMLIAVALVLFLAVVVAALLLRGGTGQDPAEEIASVSDSAVLQPSRALVPEPAAPAAEPEVAERAEPEVPAAAAPEEQDPIPDEGGQEPLPPVEPEEAEPDPTPEEAPPTEPAAQEPVAEPTPSPAPRAEPAPTPEPAAPSRTAEPVRPAPTPEPAPPREERRAAAEPAPTAEEGPSDRDRVRQLLREGNQALSSRDFGRARQQLEAARAIDDSNAEVHAALGDVYFEERDYTAAARHHRRATRLAPRNATYQRKLGMDFFRLGRFENALEAFERAVELGDAGADEYVRITQRRMDN